jgi:hypothetical protein
MVYLNANARERAERVVEEEKAKTKGSVKIAEPNQERKMDITVAQMVLASCKVNEQNLQYNNPHDDSQDPCTCPLCTRFPRPHRPSPCACSSCQPAEHTFPPIIVASNSSSVKAMSVPLMTVEEEGDTEVDKEDVHCWRGCSGQVT